MLIYTSSWQHLFLYLLNLWLFSTSVTNVVSFTFSLFGENICRGGAKSWILPFPRCNLMASFIRPLNIHSFQTPLVRFLTETQVSGPSWDTLMTSSVLVRAIRPTHWAERGWNAQYSSVLTERFRAGSSHSEVPISHGTIIVWCVVRNIALCSFKMFKHRYGNINQKSSDDLLMITSLRT